MLSPVTTPSNASSRPGLLSLNQVLSRLDRWYLIPIVFAMVLLTNAIRVPSGIMNFWAEDGVVFYSDVINKTFPERLFIDSGGGGYLNFSGKLIAEFVRIFPIDFAPAANFILVNFVYALIISLVFRIMNPIFIDKILLLILMFFVLFVPIATFDSVASSINLHFYLFFACLLILITDSTQNRFFFHLTVILTCLSDPLVFLLAPIIIVRSLIKKNFSRYLITFAIGMVIQLFSIFHFFGNSTRIVGLDSSFIKTTYLFFDRVVGSSLVPYWGNVDSALTINGAYSKVLIIRLLISFSLFVCSSTLIAISILTFFRSGEKEKLQVAIILIISSVIYWFFAGLFFNPEPRYAIFPSLCFINVILISLDSLLSTRLRTKARQALRLFSITLFVVISVGSFQVSDLRNSDLNWKLQLSQARLKCETGFKQQIGIQVPPPKNQLSLFVDCDRLLTRIKGL